MSALYTFLFICFCHQTDVRNITFTIRNNSETTVILYINKATISIQSNASYKFTKPIGTQIFLAEYGEKTALLLTVIEEMEGKKYNFLDLIQKE
jgi:hypothetical protein